MLHEFLTANRTTLIERCRGKGAQRAALSSTAEFGHGIPFFIDQLIKTLKDEQTPDTSPRVISSDLSGDKSSSDIGLTASLHGRESFKRGSTIDSVVYDYGDLCQAVTDLAVEIKQPIEVVEFRTLNRCLDNGIADAVAEFSRESAAVMTDKSVAALNERLGVLAHELRNYLHTASLALRAMHAANVGINGATGAILDRSLTGLRNLVDRSLSEVRVNANLPAQLQLLSLANFISDIKTTATLDARTRQCTLVVGHVDASLTINADRELLFSAVSNLLQNAFKFTKHCSEVYLNAFALGDRVLINIEDHCGGLSQEAQAKLFLPFSQSNADRTGLGLGLAISRRSVEANKGVLSFSNRPGSGCIFSIDLPRYALDKPSQLDETKG
jgi:signal transduction histidine kinase